MIASAISSQSGSPTTTISEPTARSKSRLSAQSRAGEHRRPQLEERHALPGDVLGAVDEQLGRPRRDPHPDAAPVRLLDDLEQPLLGSRRRRRSARRTVVEHARRAARRARQPGAARASRPGTRSRCRRGSSRASRRRCARARRSPTSIARRRTPATRSRFARELLVARSARTRDQRSRQHERRREEAEGREVVARCRRRTRARARDDDAARRRPGPAPSPTSRGAYRPARQKTSSVISDEERQPVRRALVPEEAPEQRLSASNSSSRTTSAT